MPTLSVALINGAEIGNEALLDWLCRAPQISAVIVASNHTSAAIRSRPEIKALDADPLSGPGLTTLLSSVQTTYLMLILPGGQVSFSGSESVEQFVSDAVNTGAGLLYSDYGDDSGDRVSQHPTIDYQPGSIRDTFDFGPVVVVSTELSRRVLAESPAEPGIRWGALYDLRLKLSTISQIWRIPETLYSRKPLDRRASGERLFDYVDPKQRDYQVEMEQVATGHLQQIGAWLPPEFKPVPQPAAAFPVLASVVIPVKNRERTIGDAVESALSQQTSFDYNVIVVDNHSTDRTTEVLAAIADQNPRVVHLVPEARDLGIGGCWNAAIGSEHSGRYAVQLDSDDLYQDEHSLAKIVAKLADGPYAMVVGSYTIVDFSLNPIPPGLIDHREWTRENGRNNALRINGLGAPRAFDVSILRGIGFPNTSYGEDYSVGLRISREYEIGRIFESVYLARRWEGNSDAQLDIATANQYDRYKDRLRSLEIKARQRLVAAGPVEEGTN